MPLAAIALLLAGVAVLPGCKKTIDVICRAELPVFERRIDDAIVALEASGSAFPADRQPASLPESPSVIAEGDRRAWQQWAESRLHQAQEAIDVVGAQPGLAESRVRLTAVADGLVSFHGLSSQGESRKMIAALRRVRENLAKAGSAGCAGP